MTDMPGHGGHSDMPGMDMSSDEHESHSNQEVTQPDPKPAKQKTSGTKYTCPMHPEFVTDDPNALCPKCNMRVEKMIEDSKR
jgi:hypothetical protein